MLVFNGNKFVPVAKAVQRPEIAALIEDLDLVLKSHTRFNIHAFESRLERVYTPLNKVADLPEKSGISAADFVKRNHTRKRFENVYPSDNNNAQLSISWE